MCVFGPGGEMQQAEVYLPVISRKYTMDLSRTRSYFVPGYPLDVVVCTKLTKFVQRYENDWYNHFVFRRFNIVC